MSAKITLTSIPLQLVPGVNQVFTIKYRLTTAPDVPGSYTIVSTTQVVNTSGVLVPQLVIPGLLNGTGYTVRADNNCNAAYTVQQPYITPLPSCVAPTSIVGTTANE